MFFNTVAYFLVAVTFVFGEENDTYYSADDFKCSLPDIKSVDTDLNLTRFRAEFSKISEVKFPSLIGPLNEKLICKIKCIDGNWVGPLCSTTEDGRYQPILRECIYSNDQPLLLITYKNISISDVTSFPHGSVVNARCKVFGLYKLKGDANIRCENGEWTPKFPACVPTTLITNYTGDSPPTVQYTVVSGSASVEPNGELFVYPDTTLRLDCLTKRGQVDPEWSWAYALGQYNAVWSDDDLEKDTHYRLTLNRMSTPQSDLYTCTSSSGHTNTIIIKVVNMTCQKPNATYSPLMSFLEGQKLGQAIHYSCQPGYDLVGKAKLVCRGDGRWSSPSPICVQTSCPVLNALSPHLYLVEYNSSYGGRAVFQCSWGYKLVGPPGIECEQDGRWSNDAPECVAVYCRKPLHPINGRLTSESSSDGDKYFVGALVFYSCDEGYQVVGESSIVCTENGFWSHPAPFCVLPSEVTKSDTIYLDNTTLVHVEE